MKGIMDIIEIMNHLPHRYPFLLVDRVLEMEEGKYIKALKNVTINEPFFQGHFPGHPIMPGVLIVEGMAQASGVLLASLVDNIEDYVIYFMSVDKVKWRKPVIPGDTLIYEIEVEKVKGLIAKTKGRAFVDGELVAEAEMMATFRKK